MGANVRPSGESGLTFDHILCQLQDELQKSREMGEELHNVSCGTLVSAIYMLFNIRPFYSVAYI
jgi:hypothetical protein